MNLNDTPFAPLGAHLLDLVAALEGQDAPLMLVGGFGLFLRRERLAGSGERTLLQEIPPARATEDFDLLLSLDLMADPTRLNLLHDAMRGLGYEVRPEAQNFQFVKPGSAWAGHRDVKIDLLAPEPDERHPQLVLKPPRVKPRAAGAHLHAHAMAEAVAVDVQPLSVRLEGRGATGAWREGSVLLPNAYSLLVMKLHAFRDEHEGRKGEGRDLYAEKHARDLFTIVALLTAGEDDTRRALSAKFASHPAAREAAGIVQSYFAGLDGPGLPRLRGGLGALPQPQSVRTFLDVLRETFPAAG